MQQHRVAAKTGVSYTALYDTVNGKVTNPPEKSTRNKWPSVKLEVQHLYKKVNK